MKNINAGYSFTHKRYISFYSFLRKEPTIIYKRSSQKEVSHNLGLKDLSMGDVSEIYVLNTDIETIKKAILDFSSCLLEKEIDIIQDLYVKYSKFYKIGYAPNFEFQDFTVAVIFDDFKALLFFTKDYLRETNNKIGKGILNSIDLFNNKYNGEKIKYYFKIKDNGNIIKNSIVILMTFNNDIEVNEFFIFLEKTWGLNLSSQVRDYFINLVKENNYTTDFSISLLKGNIENLYFGKNFSQFNK